MVTHRPLRCADTPLYDGATGSPTYVLSFPPTLVVVAPLVLKRWFVQLMSVRTYDVSHPLLDEPPFQYEGLRPRGSGEMEVRM
jgi:hypothetical protein